MKKWLKIILFTVAIVLYFWFILNSTNIISAFIKVGIVAFLLLGMENSRRDKEKLFLLHSDVDKLKHMDEREFIEYVSYLYKKLGYFIDLLKSKEDLGCDIVARKKQEIICIKCISGVDTIDLLPLQQVYGSLNLYKANKGMIVTTGNFTERAKQFAKSNKLELVDQERLIKQISKATLQKGVRRTASSTQEA